jgi:tripartite-type tricarboxylate transporter receptor subunit TctC
MEEAGFPGYDASQWFAVASSPKMPKDALLKVNGLLQQIFQTPEFKKAVTAAGMTTGSGTPADLVSFIEADTRKWDDLVHKTGISVKE